MWAEAFGFFFYTVILLLTSSHSIKGYCKFGLQQKKLCKKLCEWIKGRRIPRHSHKGIVPVRLYRSLLVVASIPDLWCPTATVARTDQGHLKVTYFVLQHLEIFYPTYQHRPVCNVLYGSMILWPIPSIYSFIHPVIDMTWRKMIWRMLLHRRLWCQQQR